ncbi:MAG: CTQ-dependent glycine oxidase GoxA [Chloroflexota bacterium]
MNQHRATVSRRDLLATAGAAIVAAPWGARAAVARQATPDPGSATPLPGPIDPARVARLAVFPALGICRVGNSPEWFLAPEVPGLPPAAEGAYKSGPDAIRKQAQRFRVYAFDADGAVLGEVTAAEAAIEWTVHVANTKAAWYGFSNPLDNGEAAPGLPGKRRNDEISGDRERAAMLVIDPGPRAIAGPGANQDGGDAAYRMTGRFWKTLDVILGHLRTDDAGRLIVVPGDGVSQAAVPNSPITNFSDNERWHDDWCDGPVRASVTFPGREALAADPAWVACCGPVYAPGRPPVVSLWVVLTGVAIDAGWIAPPPRPLSFREHIYPVFRALALMEWVSASARLAAGWTGNPAAGSFDDPAVLARLADPSPGNAAFRAGILALIRDPRDPAVQQFALPYMLGDGINYSDSPVRWLKMPLHQYDLLVSWAAGDFTGDLGDPDAAESPPDFSLIPLDRQPEALTRAALMPCSGGAFHPGVELTWPLRHAGVYAEPYRIAIAGDRDPSLIQDFGLLLTPDLALNGWAEAPPVTGPQMPGDLTRWMGLPWQCDAFSCQNVTFANDFPVATWWPSLLPVDVLPEAYYDALMDPALPTADRTAFLEGRVAWSRGVAGTGYHAGASYLDGIVRMLALWTRMGFVLRRPAPDDPGSPATTPPVLYVETGRGSMDFVGSSLPER